jgi:YD repeat-containing protein
VFASPDSVRTPLLAICAVVFSGAAISGRAPFGPTAPRAGALPTRPAVSAYEPMHRGYVDGSTGVYYHKNEDLVLGGTPSFVLQRTYRSGDSTSRHFGVGATHNGERHVRAHPESRVAELVLEDSTRIRFDRTSPVRGTANAMFEHRDRVTEYSGARLGWVDAFWGLWLQNGTIMTFRPCSAESAAACSLTRMRDSGNHWTEFRRDDRGTLREIAAGGATIAFEYDRAERITRARASTGRFVEYDYDSRGRLVKVKRSDGVIYSYTYGSGGEMLTIDEPGWFMRNTYRKGHVVRQDTELRGDNGSVRRLTYAWEYVIHGDRVVTTEVKRPDGSRTRYEFNQAGYHVAETLQDARGRSARVVLERDRGGQGVQRLKLTCFGANARASEHQLGNRSLRNATSELLQSCWQQARK